MQSLFPQSSAQATRNQPLLTFKAGKCIMESQGNKYKVTPDLSRGQISLLKTNDNLISFIWTDRTTQVADPALLLFPDDVEFKKVNTKQSGDRVYMLKWKAGGKVLMFWMQDKSTEKDIENCAKFNEYVNNPSAAAAQSTPALPETLGGGGVGGQMGPDAWMQLLGLGGAGGAGRRGEPLPAAPVRQPVAPTTTAENTAAPVGTLGMFDLNSIIHGVSNQTPAVVRPAPSTASSNTTGLGLTAADLARAMATIAQPRVQHPSLQDVLNPEAVIATGILQDPTVQSELLPMLPEDQQTPQFLETAIRSPQLRQALGALNESLHGEQYSTILTNFGLSTAAGESLMLRGDPVGGFLAAVEASVPAVAPTTTTTDVTEEKKETGGDEQEPMVEE